jgi:phage gpG-like protein
MSDSRQVLGSKALLAKLRRVSAAASGVVGDVELERLLLSRVRARFEQGVSPDGTPWPGLMESTVASKKRHGFRRPEAPLQATGRLLQSIQIIHGSNEGLLAGNTGAGFRIGISDKIAAVYGRLHNYGIGQERRQFIGLGRLDVVAVSGLLRRRLKSIAKA